MSMVVLFRGGGGEYYNSYLNFLKYGFIFLITRKLLEIE